MIVAFSRVFPWGAPTDFKNKIKKGIKDTTFRVGDRWTTDHIMHFWDLSPRAHKARPVPKEIMIEASHKPPCHVQKFILEYKRDSGLGYQVTLHIANKSITCIWYTNNNKCRPIFERGIDIDEVARRDGFNCTGDFFRYFFETSDQSNRVYIKGQILHWTNNKY